MQGAGMFMDLLREFVFYPIDSLVYGLIETLYNLFALISNLALFNSGDFERFATKVYLLLGMFMLFKLAFTLITLFANPDNLMDSQKGITGIVKRIIIALILITFIPTLFNLGYKIQSIIIHENIIGNFFLGNLQNDKQEVDINEVQKNAGKMVAFDVFSAFYYPEKFIIDKTENGQIKLKDYENWSSHPKKCVEVEPGKPCETLKDQKLFDHIQTKSYSIDQYGAFVVKDYSKGLDGRYYVMHYTFLISTIAGVVVAWIFFGFCIDAAIRVVKLSVLQLIAPIPVFSYIDPKKGDSIFKNWIQTTLSTYGSLLMRLVLIYFVLYVCYILKMHDIQQFGYDSNGNVIPVPMNTSDPLYAFAKMLIYIGLLLFAKDAPKLFSDMFGIKMESSVGSKWAKMGLVGTGLAAGLGVTKLAGEGYKTMNRAAAKGKLEHQSQKIVDKYKDNPSAMTEEDAAILRANAAQYSKLSEQKAHFGKALTSGVTAGIIGGVTGAKLGAGFKSGMKRANTTQKNREQGVTFGNEMQEKVGRFFGSSNEYGDFGHWSEELKTAKNEEQKLSVQESRLREHYSDMVTGLTKKYRISPDDAVNLATGDISGIASLIEKHTEELRNKRSSLEQLYNADKNLTDESKQSIKSQLESLNSQISSIENDFNGLSDSAVMVEKIDAKHQAAVKKVSKLQKNLDSLKNKN